MRALGLLLAVCAFSASIDAQEKILETLEVRVVNVDVIVTDRKGKPVHGLTRDDFEIFENGAKQPVTNLYEVRPDAAPAVDAEVTVGTAVAPPSLPPEEMRLRRVIIFIDNYSLSPAKRSQVLLAVGRFVDSSLREGDEAAIVTWSRGTHVITPFTTDRALLKQGIATLASRGRVGLTYVSEVEAVKRECAEWLEAAQRGRISYQYAYQLASSAVTAAAERLAGMTQEVLDGMAGTMSSLAGLEGRKVMVFAGAHLPERPGVDLWYWVDATYGPYLPARVVRPDALMRTSRNLRTYSIEKLAREASANGVTIYTIDAADSRDNTGADSAFVVDQTEQFMAFTNSASAYQTMARITGGVALTSLSNVGVAFDQVTRDLESYYSLGYRPTDSTGDEKLRRIEVRPKNASLRVRARQTYSQKTPADELNDRLLANLYHEGVKGDWPVTLRTGAPQRSGERFTIPVEIEIAPGALTLLPEGENIAGGFDVLFLVGDAKGARSKVSRTGHRVVLPANAPVDNSAKPLLFNAAVLVRSGESTLSVAVVDKLTRSAALAKARIAAP